MAEPTGSSTSYLRPYLFDWDDQREDGYSGKVRDKQTNELYGVIDYSDLGITRVFNTLSLTQIPHTAFIRLPKRIKELLRGTFIDIGCAQAEYEWLKENSKRSQAGEVVSIASLYWKIFKKCVAALAKEIAKIVTFPIAMIAQEFAALYGALINPLDARKLWAKLEYTWNVSDPVDIYSSVASECQNFDVFADHLTFLAPCMQPKSVWDERNLYRIISSDPESIKSLLLRIHRQLHQQIDFLEAEGLEVTHTLCELDALQKLFFPRPNMFESILKRMLWDIATIRKERMTIIDAQRDLSSGDQTVNKTARTTIANAEVRRQKAIQRLSASADVQRQEASLRLRVTIQHVPRKKAPNVCTMRDQIGSIRQQLCTDMEFLTKHGLDVSRTLQSLDALMSARLSWYKEPRYTPTTTYFVEEVSACDDAELDENGNIKHNWEQKVHAKALKEMCDEIGAIKEQVHFIEDFKSKIAVLTDKGEKSTKLEAGLRNAERMKAFRIKKLSNPCTYWRNFLPHEMHEHMKCQCIDFCWSRSKLEVALEEEV